MVTFAWFCGVGGSGLLEMTRIPPSDLLTDEKSLTTSAPQSQRRESRCLGFALVEASLLGKHLLPRRKPFAEAIPATPNLLVASKEDTLVGREMGSDPSGTRRSSSPDFAGSGIFPNLALSESPSALLLMVEHSGYL